MTIREPGRRAADAQKRLATEPNVWIATASGDGLPHLVPLSLAWIDGAVVATTPTSTPTARNAAASGRARVALDDADDVVIIDVDVEVVALDAADEDLMSRFVDRVGWDPRGESDDWSLLVMTPRRGFAWNGLSETEGRVIVRDGEWATPN